MAGCTKKVQGLTELLTKGGKLARQAVSVKVDRGNRAG